MTKVKLNQVGIHPVLNVAEWAPLPDSCASMCSTLLLAINKETFSNSKKVKVTK